MFPKRKLCPKCKIGKESYELDKRSETCPYIYCYKDGKCAYFKPIGKETNKSV